MTRGLDLYWNFLIFTNWGVIFTFVSLYLSMYAAYYRDYTSSYWRFIVIDYKALAEIIGQLAQSANIIIFIAYFTLINPPNSYLDDPSKWTNLPTSIHSVRTILVHTLPLFSTTLNMYFLSDTIAYMSDSYVTLLFGIIFILITATYKTLTGKNIYPFLTFEDW